MQSEEGVKVEEAPGVQKGDLSIKMDVESGQSGEERDSLLTSDVGVFDTVVVEDAVVDTLGGSAFFKNSFPPKGTTRDFGKEAQIPLGLGVNGSAVRGLRTANAVRARLMASPWAAPFKAATVVAAVAGVNHFVTAWANWNAIFINSDLLGIFEVSFRGLVKGDDGVNPPTVEQYVCSVVIAGTV